MKQDAEYPIRCEYFSTRMSHPSSIGGKHRLHITRFCSLSGRPIRVAPGTCVKCEHNELRTRRPEGDADHNTDIGTTKK
ncbi:MAG: hypothetical protein KAW89_08560 [Armatimonadetes bacterium]|nr:hypothetical protein [Armatimonadota bacterium]